MRRISVQQFALTGFILGGAAVFGLTALTWYFTQQTLRASAIAEHTHEVIGALGAAETQLFRAEATQRYYLVDQSPEFVRQREAAIGEMLQQLDAVAALTLDNPAQQRRIAELRPLVDQRVGELRAVQARLDAPETFMSAKDRLAEGVDSRANISPRFAAMAAEEHELLGPRQINQQTRTADAQHAFIALIIVLALMKVAMFVRLRSDHTARVRAETAAEVERHYDATHARALTLFNETSDRAGSLAGTLALLSDSVTFPASAFYVHEEMSGTLRLAAALGTPADTRSVLSLKDGPIGSAARSGKPVYLESFDPATGMHIETGLATLRPAAMLFAPVLHQGKLLGVLALAAATRLGERERAFVERLCAQLALALHNIGLLEGLNQIADQLRASGEEIHQKNEQLEHSSRMKSEFVANMSHELRTPLNAVIGFSEIMLDGLAGDLSDEQKEYLRDIHDGGRHLLSLINDVLDLSKVESGQMALDLNPVTLTEVAANGVSVVRERTLTRGIEVSVVVEPGSRRVWIDLRKAKQIVYNLLSNAVKFTADGGALGLTLHKVDRLRVESAHAAADQRVFAPADLAHDAWLEIQVTDSGIGIAPDGLLLLFQPFVQIDSTLSRKFAGTGLGLTMVKRLVELHGGGLMVQSAPGQGSTFTVWLPWRDAPAESAHETDAPLLAAVARPASLSAPQVLRAAEAPLLAAVARPAPLSAPHVLRAAEAPLAGAVVEPAALTSPLVLLIEDDPRAASLMQLQLREAGYQLEIAHNAESALGQAVALQPHAIVLDILLPGMGGWDMLGQLKQHAATRHIPVVIVSVTDEPRRGFALGAAQVLVKPVSQEDLLAALASVGLPHSNDGGTVMVVDDDPKAVTLVCMHLQAAGFTPETAYGGQQALDAVTHSRPDVMVLDLMMPQVSGFDVLDALALKPETADLPIVLLSAKTITAEDQERLRGRVQRIIQKGEFQPANLLAEVRRAVARTRTRPAAHRGPL